MTDLNKTVREIALEQPASIRVFEQFGIDYCCGGRKPLAEACAERKVALDEVVAAIHSVAESGATTDVDWTKESLEKLIDHIVAKHHAFVKQELPRLAAFAQKVVSRHGDTQPHLPAMQKVLAQLDEELIHHLGKEEHVLFPYIVKLETALKTGSELPQGCFGTVANPIAMMTREHDAAGELLGELERLSDRFTAPAGACPTYLGYYQALKEFELDLHEHIHLENNLLFPRAIEMEQATQRAVQSA